MSEPEVLHSWQDRFRRYWRVVKWPHADHPKIDRLAYATKEDEDWRHVGNEEEAYELARLAATVKALREEGTNLTNELTGCLLAGNSALCRERLRLVVDRLASEDEVLSAPIHEDPELPRTMPGMDREAKRGSDCQPAAFAEGGHE